MEKIEEIEFQKIGTANLGYISIAEVESQIPFDIKRVYWTYYTPNHVLRGHHSHKFLHQVIIAVSGEIEFEFTNSKGQRSLFKLNEPNKGLYIPPGYWRTIKFSHNAVLLCICSEKYSESDYIRDFDEFID